MSDFTYESIDRNVPLETYEWDNIWIEHADEPDRTRVLYIGDSISVNNKRPATLYTDSKILFDNYGTSKALDNPYFAETIHLVAKQEGQRSAVLFNNGLHGFHLDDDSKYRTYYEKMIQFLLEEFPKTPIFLVLTTHLGNEEREQRVIKRNAVAKELAKEYDLFVIDLYSVSCAHADLLSKDRVHYEKAGDEKMAEALVNALCEFLPELKNK
ncbi:MAG: hypothetical protein IJB48_05590 [Clostridia bacterium]|nr:hypothetical protein [Clostridia bacterium]MBQ3553303.1 hypothetical protein [Clostridia bacterium]